MSTTNSMPLDLFKKRVLPLLRAQYQGGEALAKAIDELIAETPIVDEQGNPVEVDTQMLASEGPAQDDIDPAQITEAQIAKLVDQTLAKHAKASAKAHAPLLGANQTPAPRPHGFPSFGEFSLAVHKASGQAGYLDPRLVTKAPTTYASEGAGESGGFLVPQEWADRLWEIVLGDESLISRTNQIPTSRNSLSLPVSENTAWSTGGVQAYWMDESNQITQSRPQFEYRNLRLHKLAALVPASDELLEDATALDAFIGEEAGRAIRYKADDAIINGDGVSKPLGILNSAALVTVAKEGSQTADTVVAANIVKMYARMPSSSISGAAWLINQDVLPQLLTMTLGNQPIYLPPNGISAAPFGTLLGRPILLSQHAKTLGDKGDVFFVDFTEYLTLIKRGGLQAASSVHLWFDYDVTAFRFTFRIAGQPWLSAPITPDNSTDQLSPFVTLAERT